jgi:very-short-patch-repair endonuclease
MRGPSKTATTKARSLRQAGNDAEAALWSELRNRQLCHFKFVRQLPIGPYFADFACRETRLVVEIDGSQHAGRQRDRIRDDYMLQRDWSVIRLWTQDVLREREAVLDTILAALEFRLDPTIEATDLRFFGSVSYRVQFRRVSGQSATWMPPSPRLRGEGEGEGPAPAPEHGR